MTLTECTRTRPARFLMACATCLAACSAAFAARPPARSKPHPNLAKVLMPYINTSHSVKLPDGRTIHMVCMGHGSPTVVFTAGMGNWSMIWFKVQPAIAQHTRTCAWDRAGFGLSDPSPLPQTIDNTTRDLEAALRIGHIRPPYVLVGHSLGGLESLLFKDHQPADVAGMVLVDPTYPGMGKVMKKVAPAIYTMFRNKTFFTGRDVQCAADMKAGELRPGAGDPHHCLRLPPFFPKQMRDTLLRFDRAHPGIFETRASLGAHVLQDTAMAVNPARNYASMPLIVLSAADEQRLPPRVPKDAKAQSPAFLAAGKRHHDRMARLSSRGVSRVVSHTSHYIQIIRPEVVVDAIEKVLRQTRSGTGTSSGAP